MEKQNKNFKKISFGGRNYLSILVFVFATVLFCAESAHAALNSATLESAIKNFVADGQPIENPKYGTINWVATTPTGTSIIMRVRTASPGAYSRVGYEYATDDMGFVCWMLIGSGSCEQGTVDYPEWPGYPLPPVFNDAWSDSCNIGNGQDLLLDSCVHDGDKYVQYQATLNTDSGTLVPFLSSVTISTKVGYEKDTFLKLISSPFNTGNVNNSVEKIVWSANNDSAATQGEVKFQIRTAPDSGSNNPNWTNSKWCGPTNCSIVSNSTTDFASDFYTDVDGDGVLDNSIINSTQRDNLNDQWIQYATFLKSADGTLTPQVTNVTMQYSYNTPPLISVPVVSQAADGKVNLTYQIKETRGDDANMEQTAAYAALTYKPEGVSITNAGTLTNASDVNSAAVIVVNKNGKNIPASGKALIDSELVDFNTQSISGENVTLNITTRHQSFSGAYPTIGSAHTTASAIYFLATSVTGSGLGEQSGLTDVFSVDKNIYWDVRNEASGALNGKKMLNMSIKLVANDGTVLNPVGSNATTLSEIDLESSKISSITTDPSHTSLVPVLNYNSSDSQIPLIITFSENVNFDSSGGKTIVLALNSGVCTISSSIINSNTVTCQYVIGSSDKTPTGNNLKVNSVSTNGVIVDGFGNILTDFAPISNLDAVSSIVIDNTPPTVQNLDELSDKVTKEFFTYTLIDPADDSSGIDTYEWSKVSGAGNIIFGTYDQSSTSIYADADGTYAIKIAITDKAGNFVEKTFGLIWDTTNPENAGKPNIPSLTNDNTPIISWTKATDSLSDLAKYEVQRKTGVDGTFATIHTVTDATNLSAESVSYTESSPLPDETYYYQVVATDKAENISTSEVSNAMVIDTSLPVLSSFTSTTASGLYGAGEYINITANYTDQGSGKIKAGSKMRVEIDIAEPDVFADLVANEDGTTLSGSFQIQATPLRTYDTADLNIRSIVNDPLYTSIQDLASNYQTDFSLPASNLANNSAIQVDTGGPILTGLSATSGAFNSGKTITITAKYSEALRTGSIAKVKINADSDGEYVTLSTISGSDLSGTYTVKDGDNAENLQVLSFETVDGYSSPEESVKDQMGEIGNPSTIPSPLPNNGTISTTQIDTTAPTLGSPAIAYSVSKTNNQSPLATISAIDNYDLADGKMQFSLNGTLWCNAVDYATSYAFDITSSSCGGSSANEVKTVYVKFIDLATNESQIANTTIEYDNSKPILQSITTTTESGTYGPGSNLKIIAQYNEELKVGSTITVLLNSGKQITLDQIENNNQLTTTYTVGLTGSLEDSSKLKVGSIVSQSVSDTADPTNTQDSTSLSGISENLDTTKTIIIDTAAPSGTITIDRSKTSGQITISATDQNGMDGAQVEIRSIDAAQSCGFTNAWSPYESSLSTDISESNAAAIKGCVQFKDKSGNISIYETKTPDTPTNMELDDVSNKTLNPPFLGNILTWQKPVNFGHDNAFSEYQQLSCKSTDGNDCEPTEIFSITDQNQNYQINTNLESTTKYCYQTRFKDQHGNFSKLSERICAVSGEAPVVANSDVDIVAGQENISIYDISETSAKIVFKTFDSVYQRPSLTKAKVEAYSDQSLTNLISTSQEETDYSSTHSLTIPNLTPNTAYYLKIIATDTSDQSNPNRTATLSYHPTDLTYLTFTTSGVLKTISDIKEEVITDSKAVITFQTDQDARCFIDFKLSSASVYDDISEELKDWDTYTKKHSKTLLGLIEKTPYDYKITCSDSKETIVTSEEKHFATLEKGLTQVDIDAANDKTAPEITNVALTTVTGENATITWTTNENASSSLAYEIDGADFMLMSGDYIVNSDIAKYTTSHSVQLKGLLPASKYLFTVMSNDSFGNIAQSSQSTFTTKQPSSLSSIKVQSKALGQATITWETGSATSSLVEYGLSTSYGQKKEDSSKTKEHSITLSDLTPGETYHFRVRGEDDQKNIFASSDITFQPKAPPKISDFKVDEITEHGVIIKFTTNVSTNAIVSFENTDNKEDAGFQGRPDYVSKHEIKLKDLTSGATFSIKLKVRDEDGNETEETFPNFTTAKDEQAPEIERIKTDAALTQNDKVQAIISWNTDEFATGEIVYREGKTGSEKKFEVNNTPSLNHVGVITSFKSGVAYYFKVRSMDEAGNTVTSSDYALLTPKQRQNIIQIIIGNFTDIFGWAKF